MSSRGALHAFHHQIGFAYRRLKRDSPQLALTLQPTIRAVHAGIEHEGLRISSDSHAKWPPWKKKGLQVARQVGVAHCCLEEDTLETCVWTDISSRVLAQHDSDETRLPDVDDADAVSVTETWATSSNVAEEAGQKHKKRHSRKPRRGRRARSAAHTATMFESCVVARTSSSNDSIVPTAMLGTLLECMEEDWSNDCNDRHEQQTGNGLSDHECNVSQQSSGDDEHEDAKLFEVRLRRELHSNGIGLAVTMQQDGLLITGVFGGRDESLVGVWNAMSDAELRVKVGDKIIGLNGITSPQQMLDSLSEARGAIRLKVLRGPFAEETCPPLVFRGGSPDRLNLEEDALERLDSDPVAREEAVEADLFSRREACRIEHERRKEQALNARDTVDKAELQRIIAERLAKSRNT